MRAIDVDALDTKVSRSARKGKRMKPKREITLGEMQDECKTRIKCCTGCPYEEVCGEIPKLLDLTDSPRFNEAQMESLRKSYKSGVTKIHKSEYGMHYSIPELDAEIIISNVGVTNILEVGETLDLAELLGKDGAE